MPNTVIEIGLSTAVTVGLFKLVFKRNGMEGKGWKILSVLLGLIVFIMLPFYFDDVENTGNKEQDKAVEAFSDAGTAVVRYIVSFIVFVTASIAIAVS